MRPLLLLALLLPACDQESPTGAELEPAYDWLNNPETGSPRIFRFADEFAVSWTDADNGLRATHTTIPLGDADCSAQEVLDPIAFQYVGAIDPDDYFASRLRLRADGSVWITVRDVTQPGDCFGALLVAEGPGELGATDNDAFGLNDGDNAANAWGYSAHGVLTTPDGAALSYQGVFRARASFAAGGKLLAAEVNLH